MLFIATANSLDTIPEPLFDRMEAIELSGYVVSLFASPLVSRSGSSHSKHDHPHTARREAPHRSPVAPPQAAARQRPLAVAALALGRCPSPTRHVLHARGGRPLARARPRSRLPRQGGRARRVGGRTRRGCGWSQGVRARGDGGGPREDPGPAEVGGGGRRRRARRRRDGARVPGQRQRRDPPCVARSSSPSSLTRRA